MFRLFDRWVTSHQLSQSCENEMKMNVVMLIFFELMRWTKILKRDFIRWFDSRQAIVSHSTKYRDEISLFRTKMMSNSSKAEDRWSWISLISSNSMSRAVDCLISMTMTVLIGFQFYSLQPVSSNLQIITGRHLRENCWRNDWKVSILNIYSHYESSIHDVRDRSAFSTAFRTASNLFIAEC